jgi:FkbM family methyltransferase
MRHAADTCSTMLRRVPPFPGKTRVANTLAKIVGIKSEGWGTCSVASGATVRLDLRDRIERQMWGGCYEAHVQRALRGLLLSGDVFVDIGAHVGYHAVLGASLVGPGGRIFAFEADPGNFSRLRENLQPFPWATPLNRAVWSSSGSGEFERSSQFAESGWGTLTSVRDLRTGDHFTVAMISLDDWLREVAVHVAVLKIDAEGSEVGILRGAREFLRRSRPVLIVEANDILLRQAQTSALELIDILHSSRFDVFEFSDASVRPAELRGSPVFGELLAVAKEQTEGKLAQLERSGFRSHSYCK